MKISSCTIAILISACALSAAARADTPPCNGGPCAWPVSAANTASFASDSKNKFEPSGLSSKDGYLYIASDNGRLARVDLAKDNNTGGNNGIDYQNMDDVNSLVDTDFESMTNAGGVLLVGVEGDSDAKKCARTRSKDAACPTIYEYLPNPKKSGRLPPGTKAVIGRGWVLADLPHNGDYAEGGMEGMTFVPDGHHPFTKSTGGFRGVFLAASQADKTRIYAYDLQRDGSVVRKGVIQAPVLGTAAISEMFYSSQYDTLFVLYDESVYLLQEIRMTAPVGSASYGAATQIFLSQPLAPTGKVLQGIEGLALVGDDLFIAIDQKKDEARHNGTCVDDKCADFTNHVYRYKSYPRH